MWLLDIMLLLSKVMYMSCCFFFLLVLSLYCFVFIMYFCRFAANKSCSNAMPMWVNSYSVPAALILPCVLYWSKQAVMIHFFMPVVFWYFWPSGLEWHAVVNEEQQPIPQRLQAFSENCLFFEELGYRLQYAVAAVAFEFFWVRSKFLLLFIVTALCAKKHQRKF